MTKVVEAPRIGGLACRQPLYPGLATAPGAVDWLRTAKAAGLVVARNLVGSGVRLCEVLQADGTLRVQWTMITCTELGGQLPAALTNSASAGALAAFCQGLQKSMLEAAGTK